MSDRLSSHGFATICPWALPATVSHLVFAFSGFAPKKGGAGFHRGRTAGYSVWRFLHHPLIRNKNG